MGGGSLRVRAAHHLDRSTASVLTCLPVRRCFVHRFLLVLAVFLGACPAAQARPAPELRACTATCQKAKTDCRARVNARVAEQRASCTGSRAQRNRCLLAALTASVEGKRDCKHFVRDVCVPCCKQGGTDCAVQCGNGVVEGGEECDP